MQAPATGSIPYTSAPEPAWTNPLPCEVDAMTARPFGGDGRLFIYSPSKTWSYRIGVGEDNKSAICLYFTDLNNENPVSEVDVREMLPHLVTQFNGEQEYYRVFRSDYPAQHSSNWEICADESNVSVRVPLVALDLEPLWRNFGRSEFSRVLQMIPIESASQHATLDTGGGFEGPYETKVGVSHCTTTTGLMPSGCYRWPIMNRAALASEVREFGGIIELDFAYSTPPRSALLRLLKNAEHVDLIETLYDKFVGSFVGEFKIVPRGGVGCAIRWPCIDRCVCVDFCLDISQVNYQAARRVALRAARPEFALSNVSGCG